MLLVDIFVELFICLCLFSNILNSVSVFNCFNRPICDLILTVHMEKMTECHYIRLSYHNLGQVRQDKYMVLWRKIRNYGPPQCRYYSTDALQIAALNVNLDCDLHITCCVI